MHETTCSFQKDALSANIGRVVELNNAPLFLVIKLSYFFSSFAYLALDTSQPVFA